MAMKWEKNELCLPHQEEKNPQLVSSEMLPVALKGSSHIFRMQHWERWVGKREQANLPRHPAMLKRVSIPF